MKMDRTRGIKRRKTIVSHSKRTIMSVLLVLVLVLIVLPFWTSFQDLLTRLVMSMRWYRGLQDLIVPYELRVVGSVLSFAGFPIRVSRAYIEWTKSAGGNEVIYLAWNCIGWQTLVLFVITLLTGLSGKHTLLSKLETLATGILGTYLINILRLSLVVVVYFMVGRPFGVVFHDYFSNLLTIAWLILYWWFSYGFVLKEIGAGY